MVKSSMSTNDSCPSINVNQNSVQASLLPAMIEPASSMELTQDQMQLESESLSEKADLE